MKKNKNKKIIPKISDDRRQKFIHDPEWKQIYLIEDKINNIISNIHGYIFTRCEINELYAIKIQFTTGKKNYEYIISKRENNYGFSICNIDDIENMHKYSSIGSNKTIENNKFYLYNIYKIFFNIVGV
jgi:hypothetical protein